MEIDRHAAPQNDRQLRSAPPPPLRTTNTAFLPFSLFPPSFHAFSFLPPFLRFFLSLLVFLSRTAAPANDDLCVAVDSQLKSQRN